MPVLITGAGLVGCQIARELVERGETPVLFEIAPQMNNIAAIVDPSKVRIVKGDVLEPMDLLKVIRDEGIDRIIHTVTLFGLSAGVLQRAYLGIKVNIMGTVNVLEAARVMGIKRVVFTSTSTVYYRPLPLLPGETLPEDFPVFSVSGRSKNIYATAKYASEQLGLNYWDSFGLDFVAVRFAAVFGPWQGPVSGVIGERMQRLVASALQDQTIVVDEDAMWPGKMDIVYSKDAANATLAACFAENPLNRVYNVSMGRPYDMGDIVRILRELLPGREISLKEAERKEVIGYTLPTQAMDLSRSRAEIGYDPKYDMQVALRDYLSWLREGK